MKLTIPAGGACAVRRVAFAQSNAPDPASVDALPNDPCGKLDRYGRS